MLASVPDAAYQRVRMHALVRATAIREARFEAEYLAHSASLLVGRTKLRRDGSITRADGLTIRLRFDNVPPRIGHVYQEKLHYLMSARGDTIMELGLFLGDAAYPISYLSFSACDRPYMVSALNDAGIAVRREQVLVLTRVYGLPRVPPGLMSFTISRALRHIRASMPYRIIVTAFNPTLGFRGTAFQASGFAPFATAPVTYAYDDRQYFTTRRRSSRDPSCSKLDTRNNVLVALGIDKRLQRNISSRGLVVLGATEYEMTPTTEIPQLPIEHLQRIRQRLEAGWSTKTMHPSYAVGLANGLGPMSRGQCGVSSLWLAVDLKRRLRIDAAYCCGRLSTDGPAAGSIDYHCWLEIGASNDAGRLIVDLTCDQAEGLGEKVLCEQFRTLLQRGIRYQADWRSDPEKLQSDPTGSGQRVWRRYHELVETIGRPGESLEEPEAVDLAQVSA